MSVLRRLWQAARLCALAAIILISPAALGTAWAACDTSLDFSGAAINDTRTLDVSTCSNAVRWGLYAATVDSAQFWPVTGTAPASSSTPAQDVATITLGNGAQFTVTAHETDITDDVPSQASKPADIYVFDSYTVQLTVLGNSDSDVYVFKYADNARPYGPFPLDTVMTTDTDFSVTFNNVPEATPAPAISSLSPASGSTAGGTSVVITGTDFTGVTAVAFGANPATGFTFNSDTQITATAPAGSGTVDVTVTTPGGTSANTAADDYTYVAPPTLTSFTFGSSVAYGETTPTAIDVATGGSATGAPTSYAVVSGTTSGGGSVSIDNAGSASYTPAASFRGNDTFQVTATNAGGTSAPATVTVTVSNPTLAISLSGTGAAEAVALSGYSIATTGGTAPYSCNTTPASGALPGGVSIASDCSISGTPASAGSFDFTVEVTDSSTGTGPFTATSGTLTLVVAGASPPSISAAFSPASITTSGSSTLTLTITNTNALLGLTNVSVGAASLPVELTGSSPLTTCTSGTASLSSGTLSLSGGELAAGTSTSCTVTVLVQPTQTGSFSFTTGAVSAAESGPGSTAVSNSLTVSASTVSSLASLVPSTGSLSPAFASGTLDYDIAVPNGTTSIALTPTATDAGATITVDGNSVSSGAASGGITLPVGATAVPVVVTAEDGVTQTTYTVTVTRAASSESGLSSLVPSTGSLSPAFASGTLDYDIAVPNGTTSIMLTPTASDAGATITVDGTGVTSGAASGSITLPVGATAVPVVVTAEDGVTQTTYTITITRAGSSESALSSLVPSTGSLSPAFASGTLGYDIAVPNGTTSITLTPTATDAGATITVNGNSVASGAASGSITLPVGATAVPVVVTAEDGVTQTTYTVTITRGSAPVVTPAAGALPAGTVGLPYSQVIGATSGTAPYSFSVGSGALPANLTLDGSSGEISGTPSTIENASFTVDVTDSSAPQITVSVAYTLAIGPASNHQQVIEETHALVTSFVEMRQNLLWGHIGAPSLADRRSGSTADSPLDAGLQPTDDGLVFNFASSLAQVEATERLAAGVLTADTNPFNIWIDGSLSLFTRSVDGGTWGNFAVISGGADYLLNERLLLGLALHYDRIEDPAAPQTTITGDGWLVGPYASAELGDGVFLDLSALYGGSVNRLDGPVWDGDFSTERWRLDAALSGLWQLSAATSLAPRLRLVYQSETTSDYAIADGMGGVLAVDGSVSEDLSLSLGAALSHKIALDDGATLTPRLDAAAGLSGTELDAIFGALEAGVTLETVDDWSIHSGLRVTLDDVGVTSVGAKLGLSGQM